MLSQATPGVHDEPNANDNFGEGLAAGDFDGDGFEDLAVGAPGESPRDGGTQIGLVQVIYGGPSGLDPTSEVPFQLSDLGAPGEDFTFFGKALTAGNFGKSPQDDLAIVSPGLGGTPRLVVIYGGAGRPHDIRPFGGDLRGPGLHPEFFSPLAAANFGSSWEADLAVGLPEASESASDAGAVGVLYGAPGGLSTTSAQLWQQGAAGLFGVPEDGDSFGTALAARNLDDESRAELGDRRPGQVVHGHRNAGAVQVLGGGPGGLTATGNRIWTLDSAGVDGDATDNAALRHGAGREPVRPQLVRGSRDRRAGRRPHPVRAGQRSLWLRSRPDDRRRPIVG